MRKFVILHKRKSYNSHVSQTDVQIVTIRRLIKNFASQKEPAHSWITFSPRQSAFGNPKALRAFLCTDVSLTTDEILSYYVCRWPIEVFFRQCKDKPALDTYQIRSAKGIRRYWLLMSPAHYICVMGTGKFCSFENGYHQICDIIQQEKYRYLFQCAKASSNFESFMKLAV